MKNRALILCGGYGTRLQPLTDKLPKPLLPVRGKPLLGYMLEHLSNQGIREVAINLHYMKDQIKDFCKDGSQWNLSIHYHEEEELLGTAGTVKALGDWLTFSGKEPFLVIYGDLLTYQDFNAMYDFHREKKSLATILVYPGRDNSIVKTDANGKIEFFLERPSSEVAQKMYHDYPSNLWINGGMQILSPELLDLFPAKEVLDLPRDIYVPLVGKHAFYAFPLTSYRQNIDSLEALEKAEKEITAYELSA